MFCHRLIYDKIDKDQNGEVSVEELMAWIQHVQMRYIWSDTDRQWRDHFPEDDDKTQLTWEVYMEKTYGHVDGIVACCTCCLSTGACSLHSYVCLCFVLHITIPIMHHSNMSSGVSFC